MLYRAAEQGPCVAQQVLKTGKPLGIFHDFELCMITITCFPSQGIGCESMHDNRRKEFSGLSAVEESDVPATIVITISSVGLL